MENYSLKKVVKEDFSLLIPLMQDCFGMDVNLKYFEWKFINNPAGFVHGYMAVHVNGDIAAFYGAIPEVYLIENEQRIVYQSCDTMTHSKHRRKGLFQRLALHCYQSLSNQGELFIIGFGGGPSTPGFIKFGWKEVFKMKYYFYPKIFKYFANLNYKSAIEITDFREIEHLTLNSNNCISIHSLKTAEVFDWRTSNPMHNYKTFSILNSENVYSSYLTYYEEEDRIILFDQYIQNKKDGKQLFDLLKSLLKGKKKGIIAFVQEKSIFVKTLKNYNFISNPFKGGPLSHKTPFIFFASEFELQKFNNNSKWSINSFDHDAL